MGYILPVMNEQYNQYAIRDMVYKRRETRLEETNPITKIQPKNPYQYSYTHFLHDEYRKGQKHENVTNQTLIASLTGKGRNFHALV